MLNIRDGVILYPILVRVRSASPVVKKPGDTTPGFFTTGPEGEIFTGPKIFPEGPTPIKKGILSLCGTSIF
jgi:hypothetical protein